MKNKIGWFIVRANEPAYLMNDPFFAYINEEGFYGHHRFSQRIARCWYKTC